MTYNVYAQIQFTNIGGDRVLNAKTKLQGFFFLSKQRSLVLRISPTTGRNEKDILFAGKDSMAKTVLPM